MNLKELVDYLDDMIISGFNPTVQVTALVCIDTLTLDETVSAMAADGNTLELYPAGTVLLVNRDSDGFPGEPHHCKAPPKRGDKNDVVTVLIREKASAGVFQNGVKMSVQDVFMERIDDATGALKERSDVITIEPMIPRESTTMPEPADHRERYRNIDPDRPDGVTSIHVLAVGQSVTVLKPFFLDISMDGTDTLRKLQVLVGTTIAMMDDSAPYNILRITPAPAA